MKTNFKEKDRKQLIELGDALVLKDGTNLLVIMTNNYDYPWALINIETMDTYGAYQNISYLGNAYANDVVRIIKHENLEIREVE